MGGAARNRGGTRGHGSLPLAGAKLNWNQHIISDKLIGKAHKFIKMNFEFNFIFTVRMVDHGKSRPHHKHSVGQKLTVKEMKNISSDATVKQSGTTDRVLLSGSKKVIKDENMTIRAPQSLHPDKEDRQKDEHSVYTQERLKATVIVKSKRNENEMGKKQPTNKGSVEPLTRDKGKVLLDSLAKSCVSKERHEQLESVKSTPSEDQLAQNKLPDVVQQTNRVSYDKEHLGHPGQKIKGPNQVVIQDSETSLQCEEHHVIQRHPNPKQQIKQSSEITHPFEQAVHYNIEHGQPTYAKVAQNFIKIDEDNKDDIFQSDGQSPSQQGGSSLVIPHPCDNKNESNLQPKCSKIDNSDYKLNSSWNYSNPEIFNPAFMITSYNLWGFHNQSVFLPVTYQPPYIIILNEKTYIDSIHSQGGYLLHDTTNHRIELTSLPPASVNVSQKGTHCD